MVCSGIIQCRLGNVQKVFANGGNRKSIDVINKLSSSQVYNELIAHLPSRETRDYLRLVRERSEIYEKSDLALG